MPHKSPIAAIDLGSNSFHLMVAEPRHGQPKILDRLREGVRLAAGLDSEGRLASAAVSRALACLERFGERVRHLPQGAVRAVGTNALRKARNADAFLAEAERLLNHPIDVISGIEEARLIYLGVSHGLAEETGQRLVMDIGGGSTELIIGERHVPITMESLHMGCVSMTERYFGDGRIDAKRLRQATLAAAQEFEPIEEAFRAQGWQSAIGASGTLMAIADALHAQPGGAEKITRPGLTRLRDMVIDSGQVSQLHRLGIREDRSLVFPGGLAIALAAFEELDIKAMQVSESALREGLLYDLMGRIEHEDIRDHTVAVLMQRFHVDAAQMARVEVTALQLLADVAPAWGLEASAHAQLLSWAVRLHEIGTSVSHSQYQKHGAYLLQFLDMPGFSRGEQRRLGFLVRAHRRKFPQGELAQLPEGERETCRRLAVILRLAVVLHRARRPTPLPPFRLVADGGDLRLELPADWLDDHALVSADLDEEAEFLRGASLKLRPH
jgi:exopolyphosphatase/guanosine-5'-triphosphate,3'-diphosphate pyrophosphatase